MEFPRLHLVTGDRPLATVACRLCRLAPAERLAVQVRVEDDVTDREAFALTLRCWSCAGRTA